MGLFSALLRESNDGAATETAAQLHRMNMQYEDLQHTAAQLLESNGMLALKLEDYQWTPIQGWAKSNGFSLDTIKAEADTCRALYAINPLIKKAVNARIGYIHGRGVRIEPGHGTGYGQQKIEADVKANSRKVFGAVGRGLLETELSVAGNVWAMREGNKPAVIIPIEQIDGYISEVDDPSVVLYWKRRYEAEQTNLNTGTVSTVEVMEYIPTLAVTKPEASIGQIKVRRSAKMFHVAANKQSNWVLGLPDMFAAKFWARGHKEMAEAGHEFTMAQGKVAAKVVGNNRGTQLAASRLADEPRRDPETGEIYEYGNTAVMSNGLDYQLMGKMGGSVDFNNYDPIVGLIAAGTGVPRSVLLATADNEETSLEQSVVDDMKMRQHVWGEFYEDLLHRHTIQCVWPRIKQETVYRVQQAVEIASRTNTLTEEEKRLLTLEAFGLEGLASETPDISNHPDVQVYLAKKQIDLEYAEKLAAATAEQSDEDSDRSTTPDQGVDTGIGKLSDGEDAHDARDAGEQEHTR